MKKINEDISAQKHNQTTIFVSFISSVIQFDKFFYPVVLYENYLICIFMSTYKIINVSFTMCFSVSNLEPIQCLNIVLLP